MTSLKGDKAAQRKRRQQERSDKVLSDRKPRMEPNVRIKSYKLEEFLEDDDGS